jgi:hypothetical protein
MKISPKLLILAAMLWGLHWPQAASGSSEADRFSSSRIPIFPQGYHVETHVDPATKSELLAYYVRRAHPAAEVLKFYDVYFNGIGWQSSFEICQRHWDDTAFNKANGKLQARQLFTSWQSPDAKIKVSLWLISKPYPKSPPEEVLVKFSIQSNTDP